MNLSKLLKCLANYGCYPCISMRDKLTWRAYVNGAGDCWADANTPRKALTKAMEQWQKAGCPIDGYAATGN